MSVVFLDCWINVRYKLHCLFCKRVVIMSCRFNMFQTFIKCNFLKRRFLQNTYNVILSIHLIYLSWKICSEIENQMKLNSFLELFIRNSWPICGLIISRFCQLPGEMLEINCRTFTIFYKIETEKKKQNERLTSGEFQAKFWTNSSYGPKLAPKIPISISLEVFIVG